MLAPTSTMQLRSSLPERLVTTLKTRGRNSTKSTSQLSTKKTQRLFGQTETTHKLDLR